MTTCSTVATDEHVGRGARSYYHADLLGSTRAVAQGGSVVESYDFEPFGLLMPGRTLGSGTKEGFTGKEQDAETGFDYFGARLYLPAVGRWTSVDPPADSFPSWSPYAYVGNDPASKADPFGRCPPAWLCDLMVLFAVNHPQAAAEVAEFATNVARGTSVWMGGSCQGPGCGVGVFLGAAGIVLPTAKLPSTWAAVGSSSGEIGEISNPVPTSLARVIPAGRSPTNLASPELTEAYVTDPAAIRGLNANQIQERLTIQPSKTGYEVIEFPTADVPYIASPINRSNPGFVGRGRTRGGAPEFVVPNVPIPGNAIRRLVQPI